MHLTIAYSKIKKWNLVLINNDTYQRETLSERPIRQPLKQRSFQPCLRLDTQLCHVHSQSIVKFIWKKYTSGPRYWNVPVLVNTGTFYVYQYCPKMWYLRSLEHASVIQKLTILEHKNGLVLSNTRVPVSGTWSILFPFIWHSFPFRLNLPFLPATFSHLTFWKKKSEPPNSIQSCLVYCKPL